MLYWEAIATYLSLELYRADTRKVTTATATATLTPARTATATTVTASSASALTPTFTLTAYEQGDNIHALISSHMFIILIRLTAGL